jgi:DnaK suppressor protein
MMPSTPTLTDSTQIAERLRQRSRVLRGEIHAALLRAGTERYADIAGRLQDAQDYALAELLAEVTHADIQRDADELRDIDGALQRLAAGTWGRCVACGTKVPPARLDAYPTAKRCLSCQQLHERARTGIPVAGPA